MERVHDSRLFLVDGHNLLYALRPRFAPQLVEGHPGTAAREALVESLLGVFTDREHYVRLYFDGNTPNREQRSARLEVIYPGGQGDQCADQAILRDLAECNQQVASPHVTVVTRDIKLARRARKRGASVIDPEAFYEAWMNETHPAGGQRSQK